MIATAFLIGLAGSLHCVGMCSPLVMAVSSLTKSHVANRLMYNGGRLLTYGMLGAMVGALGGIAGLTEMQNLLSTLMGMLLILFGVVGIGHFRVPFVLPAMLHISAKLKSLFNKQIQSRSRVSMILLGAINGLLPCGLTYFALSSCIILPGATEGFTFMMVFGLGTLPAMVGLPALLRALVSSKLIRVQRFTAMVMIALGCLLVVRSAYFGRGDMDASTYPSGEVVCP